MTINLDLNLVPISRYAGQEYPDLLGLFTAEPPRRPARGRSSDRLVLYLAMDGNAPLPPGKRDQILADLAKLYFKTPGSATSALRAVAEGLNGLLLKRNLRLANSGRQGMGLLTQIVLRGQQLYVAQSGPVHAYWIAADDTQYWYDPDMEGRALGQGRATLINYFQAILHPDDTLLLTALPSPSWNTASLGGIHGQGPESTRRRLFTQTDIDLNAVLIQAKSGKGRFYLISPAPQPSTTASETGAPDELQTSVSPGGVLTAQEHKESEMDQHPDPDLDTAAMVGEAPPPIASPGDFLANEQTIPGEGSESPIVEKTGPVASTQSISRPRVDFSPLRKALAFVLVQMVNILRRIAQGIGTLLGRMLPEGLSPATMAFIAIAIPVVVVTIASLVYVRLGSTVQYEILLAQAEQLAAQAASQTDIQAQIPQWGEMLKVLQQAENYGHTPEIEELREQALSVLDEFDLVRRVDYINILDDLQAAVNVTRMVVSDNDLYLLDGNTGDVIRAISTDQGYVVDPSFQCGPNAPGVSLAGPLIDLISWPPGYTPEATIVGVDSHGFLLFCHPDQSAAKIVKLADPPSGAYDEVMGFALDLGDLYILDPLSNAVWVYWKSSFEEEPSLFFDEEIPYMQDMSDLEVSNGELYLLHDDGRLTLCIYSGLVKAPTRCSDPQYVDLRPGRENIPLVPPNPFTQIQYTTPPDPSLFLLEPVSHAIYHFSLRNLAFQRQYLPKKTLSTRPATAFYVYPLKQTLFLAVGNQVYYAIMP